LKSSGGPGCVESSLRRRLFRPEVQLFVEVDGGQHVESATDVPRTRWPEAQGYPVIRFRNNDVLANTEGVLPAILDALRA
jgi:very-short-patch-repair endonuclease